MVFEDLLLCTVSYNYSIRGTILFAHCKMFTYLILFVNFGFSTEINSSLRTIIVILGHFKYLKINIY